MIVLDDVPARKLRILFRLEQIEVGLDCCPVYTPMPNVVPIFIIVWPGACAGRGSVTGTSVLKFA